MIESLIATDAPWAPLAPMLAVLATALTVLVLELVIRRPGRLLAAVSMLGLGTALALAIAADPSETARFGGLVLFDEPGRFASLIVLGAALAVAVASSDFEQSQAGVGEFYTLALLATFGALVVAASADLVMFLVGVEALSLPLYALVTWRRGDRRAFEGATKYFVTGAFATALMVFGFSLLVGAAGTTRILDMGRGMVGSGVGGAVTALALAFTAAGVAFKLGAAPFHYWVMDAYEASTPAVAGLLAVIPKAATLAVAIRLIASLDPYSHLVGPGLALLAVLSMTVGNLGALGQRSFARLMGYSSVAQTGYVLVGLAVMSQAGYRAAMSYFAVYAVGALGALIAVATVRAQDAGDLDDLAGLGTAHPLVAFALGACMLSLTGIPPLAGFFGKFALFATAIAGGVSWLAVIGLAFSVVSLGYYGAVLRQAYLTEGEPVTQNEPGSAGVAVAGLVAILLLVAVFPAGMLGPLFR